MPVVRQHSGVQECLDISESSPPPTCSVPHSFSIISSFLYFTAIVFDIFPIFLFHFSFIPCSFNTICPTHIWLTLTNEKAAPFILFKITWPKKMQRQFHTPASVHEVTGATTSSPHSTKKRKYINPLSTVQNQTIWLLLRTKSTIPWLTFKELDQKTEQTPVDSEVEMPNFAVAINILTCTCMY